MKKNYLAIIVMMFLFAMIAFVTNLAAPIGIIWKNAFAGSENANTIGILGNAMNFLAYLFMGIPAGKLLVKLGYKKTALVGVTAGFVGIFMQYLSGFFNLDISGFSVYLMGAFVSGVAVCVLNTVVNPMLNLLGGGGNRGNQLILIGGTLNSLSGTLTPMLVGSLIGTVTARTLIVDVNPVLFIAMGVFAVAFAILFFVPIEDPQAAKVTDTTVFEHSPWSFRHFKLGTLAIFVYVGCEVGIPSTLIFYISDTTLKGGGAGLSQAAAVAGCVAGTYWFLMLVGRFIAGFIAKKVSSKSMMTVMTAMGIVLLTCAIFFGNSSRIDMYVFDGTSFFTAYVPIAVPFLVCCGLCTSVLWPCIFNLATEGLGKYSNAGSGIFMMMVVGGGVLPLLQNYVADKSSYMLSYLIPLVAFIYMFVYAVYGSKNVNTDIQV